MSTYKYKSGAQKRKEREEGDERKKKLPKITQFFSSPQFTQSKIKTISPVLNPSINPEPTPSCSYFVNPFKNLKDVDVDSDVETVASSIDTVIGDIRCDDIIKNDKGYYTDLLTTEQKRYLVENQPCRPLGPFPRDDQDRKFSSFYYNKINKSGLKTERLWLCYSPILNKCYCQPCWLFAQSKDTIANGFNDWAHLNQAINRHEQKLSHNESCAIFDRWRLNKTIDHELESSIRQEVSIWRQILERIVEVTLTLASCNMPFRGHDESFISANPGIFLSVINLLSKYDLVLKNLLHNKKKNTTTYLSPLIQNEVIGLLGIAIKNKIIEEIKTAQFYSVIIDTTQDIAKIDQLSAVVRYVTLEYVENKPTNIIIKESFLEFVPVENQTGSALKNNILAILIDNGLPLEKLRGQGYDGAANMSGIYKGVQAEILKVAPNAPYVHCAAHNLNLILNDSVKNVEEIRNFYGLVESVYVFFGHSIKRWALLETTFSLAKSKITLKKLTPTRWSSRHDALEALRFRYVDVLKALSKISLTSNNKFEIDEAKSLKTKLECFETVFLIVFETKILKNIDVVSKLLQSKQQNIEQASKMFNTTFENIKKMRDNFLSIRNEANNLAGEWGTILEFTKKRISRPKTFFDENNDHFKIQSKEDWFKINVFYKTLDIIVVQLKHRSFGLNELYRTFNVLSPNILCSASDEELYQMGQDLYIKYSEDISDTISSQLLSFRQCFKNELSKINSIMELTEFIAIKNFSSCSSFSEILTVCYIFLTIPVSVASAERSFSKLKLIKNFLRNTMGEKRLSALSIISIENEIARSIDISSIVSTFAHVKARKNNFE